MSTAQSTVAEFSEAQKRWLFIGCFVALTATSFGFVVRTQLIGEWGVEFNLTEVQKGEIFGVGLWPFAISIILFSLVIDKIGYGKAMVFAFACHIMSVILTIYATGYWPLYIATFIAALGNGTVEAVINPAVATMYPKDKTKWLIMLHAGWPAGLVLGGILAIGMGSLAWEWKAALILIPTVIYGAMLFRRSFPVNERVASGVSYNAMLKEAGGLGALIVLYLIISEIGRVFNIDPWISTGIAVAMAAAFGFYVKSLGRPIFVILLLIMIPLATTELGTDAWITPLMETEMSALGLNPGWVLIYTSAIMLVLRLFAGPIVHKLSPLGLLMASSAVAAAGLVALSSTAGMMIFVAATIYGLGKTFFWPTMLGIVAEQYPKGGALTLNATGGVGMLGVGVVGAVFLGLIQDQSIDTQLANEHPAIHAQVVTTKNSVFGEYDAVDPALRSNVSDSDNVVIDQTIVEATKGALTTVAIFPVLMFLSYLGLILFYRSQGGYRPKELADESGGT
ncbi:MAG: MFS transporter [Proteobacteria bacterium]|nr:MFS transporter [Pseudomonadota bacterium]